MPISNEYCVACEKGELQPFMVRNFEYRTPMGIVTIEGENALKKCSACSEVFLPGEQVTLWNRLILEKLAKKKGLLTPEELCFVFSVLPYSQNELAKATGRERSTLSRYKNGENPVDPLFVDVLQSIILDYIAGNERTLERLRAHTQFLFQEETIKKVQVG